MLSADASIKSEPIRNGSRVLKVKVENFGLAESPATQVDLTIRPGGSEPVTIHAPLAPLAPYAGEELAFSVPADLAPSGTSPSVEIVIKSDQNTAALKVALPKLP